MKLLAVIFASLFVVACSSTKKVDTTQTNSGENNNQTTTSTTAATASSMSANALTDEIKNLEQGSEYFDFNKYEIKAEYNDILQTQANFIKSHKNDMVTLEGNCDERGSLAYNMKLGKSRSMAVKKHLVKLGVPSSQLKVVSYGKERPRLTCHDEKCWKENRRVDFIHHVN